MEQVFETKVKEKRKKLKEMEAEVGVEKWKLYFTLAVPHKQKCNFIGGGKQQKFQEIQVPA